MSGRLMGVEQVGQPDDEDRLCGCGDVLNGTLDARCGNCIAADLSVIERRADELEAIVRDLATVAPLADLSTCKFCGDIGAGDHHEDCVSLRAKRWVSAHPVPGDPA